MDNFRIIYKILHILERTMNMDEFNALETKKLRILKMR
jgi:hypothetical protein